MTNQELRESLKRVFFFLDHLEIKGVTNADLVTAAAQMLKRMDNALENARRRMRHNGSFHQQHAP